MSASAPVVEFLQELIRIPSPPGEEEEAARRVAEEMEGLGYDEVDTDAAGNVVGRIRGAGEAPDVMLNAHLDHVGVGREEAWPRPPFGGEIHGGRIWGRGAVDIKGPLAAQVHGAGRLAGSEDPPPGDVYVTAVVQEEVGGLGARHLVEELRPALTVVGEPSSNQIRRGHRGRTELELRLRGRSVHASAPERGANPLYALAAFLEALRGVELPEHEELGGATVAPTRLRTDQESTNVTPAEVWLTLDCRLPPGTSAEEMVELLEPLAREACGPGMEGRLQVPVFPRTSYTGLEMEIPADNPAFLLPLDHPAVTAAVRVVADALGGAPEVDVWRFATDGGHFSAAGLTVVGFGPGEEELAHTVDESVEVEELERAVAAYEALARRWPEACLEAAFPESG